MLSLYEILKTSKTGIAPDMWTALAGMNWGSADSGHEVKELTGIPPLSFTANGQPLIDYLISGNLSQSGTPTPTTPIQPNGTGERTGNLWDGTYQKAIIGGNSGNVYSTNSSGRTVVMPCSPNTTYTIKKHGTSNRFMISESNKLPVSGDAVDIIYNEPSAISHTFTTSGEAKYMLVYVSTSSEQAEPPLMINAGTEPLPYEPYGYKIPISSANTTTNIYLGEVETTRKIKKYECTGQEQWQFFSDSTGAYGTWQFYVNNVINGLPTSSAWSNIADYGVTTTTRSNYLYGAYLVTSGTGVAFQMAGAKDTFTDIASWKSYLAQQYAAGTPVTVWYVLATEETGIDNEPLRKIGDYADTVSYEQAGVQIPTLHGNTVIDVETTLKPSEMYIKYQE